MQFSIPVAISISASIYQARSRALGRAPVRNFRSHQPLQGQTTSTLANLATDNYLARTCCLTYFGFIQSIAPGMGGADISRVQRGWLAFRFHPPTLLSLVCFDSRRQLSFHPAKKKDSSPNRESNTGLMPFQLETRCTYPTTIWPLLVVLRLKVVYKRLLRAVYPAAHCVMPMVEAVRQIGSVRRVRLL